MKCVLLNVLFHNPLEHEALCPCCLMPDMFQPRHGGKAKGSKCPAMVVHPVSCLTSSYCRGFFLSMADHHSNVLSIFWEHGKLLIKPAFCTVFCPRRMERLTIVSSLDMKSNEFQWRSAWIHDLCVGLCRVCGREIFAASHLCSQRSYRRWTWSVYFAKLCQLSESEHRSSPLLSCVWQAACCSAKTYA